MRKLRAFWLRLFGLLGARRSVSGFDDEIASHVAMHTADGVRAGLSEAEARRQALLRLGGAEQARQAYRERRTLPWIEDLLHDVRYALRMMMRNRGFTAVAVLTLAIGIAAGATVFSWINAVLIQPLAGVSDPARLVTLNSVTPNGEVVPNSYPDFIDFRDQLKLFDGIAVSRPTPLTIGMEDHAERVWGELVSGNFFSVLGVQPEAGRLFLPAEFGDAPGKYPVAVISDRYWRSHYGADPSIVGKTLRVNQHELTIVGVAAPEFHGSLPVTAYEIWIPYMEQPVLNGVKEWMLRDRHNRNMLGLARLKPGVTIDAARAEADGLARRMAKLHSDVSEGMGATVLPIWKSPFGAQALLVGPLRLLAGRALSSVSSNVVGRVCSVVLIV